MTDSTNELHAENTSEPTQAASSANSPVSQPATESAAPHLSAAETSEFGRVDEAGNVFVRDGDAERQIGAYPDGLPENPLGLYLRRFESLEATVKLFEDRLATLAPKEIDQTLATLRESVIEPAAIGDLVALRARVEAAAERAQVRKEQAREERRLAKEAALRERTELVERAEAILTQDPHRMHWKQCGQTLRELLDEWKNLQRRGPRLDKATEDALWKRFSGARTQFDRQRRQFFSALDQAQTDAKRVKEQLIAEAEALQTSTDWGATTAAYRTLMDRWKTAPRASRKEDDALWTRFRAAQQVFFDARRAKDLATDSEYRENLAAKEALLIEAEALLPINDLEKTKEQLRQIQERWDSVGRVPAADHSRIDHRLRAVEDAVRAAEEHEWRRTNPETRARAEGMLGQLEEQIARLEKDCEAARVAGNSSKEKELSEALATKKAWLDQIRSSMD
ncbi:DUF349 domain-containing protein [Schaalia sp. lx-100]|uniref:DUF349 domain-containing protein n=1 Tax=Schaalia sp. lx-100 TaxID=2899081 RepID=UPI001E50E3CA|nr:DUF349 domain-containing protein [Schaalia sp. lx-100]